MSSDKDALAAPLQSPFFRALNAPRYERQTEIRQYEEATSRSLIVVHGPIAQTVITPFADAINDVGRGDPLDLMLTSLGGDGETALRMASMCHGGREDFRIIVADMAASAATLLALAAETIVMSDTSALGPIDPQVPLQRRRQYFPAKDIVAIVEDLEERSKENPQAFELYASLLADIDAVIYQTAKAAIRRTEELVPELLRLRLLPPDTEEINTIAKELQSHALHSATIGHQQAKELGLPILYMPGQSDEWDMLWRLHTRYVALLGAYPNESVSIEGRRVSFQFNVREP
ncbi:MAG: hypothetical protein OXG55_00985 [bacterium]|nr:hypothetical protein [bacterium]MCY4101829.1 hypothetical protein [bacterium]